MSEFGMMRVGQVLTNDGRSESAGGLPAETEIEGPICLDCPSGQCTEIPESRVELPPTGQAEERLHARLVAGA
jgi:hypothetical protein